MGAATGDAIANKWERKLEETRKKLLECERERMIVVMWLKDAGRY